MSPFAPAKWIMTYSQEGATIFLSQHFFSNLILKKHIQWPFWGKYNIILIFASATERDPAVKTHLICNACDKLMDDVIITN